jgi:hypothetical protein
MHKTSDLKIFGIISIAIISFRAYLYHRGLIMSDFNYLVQFSDSELLKNDLLRTVFFDHYQPPLVNLVLGVLLKIFPQNYQYAFIVIHIILTILTTFILYKILSELAINKYIIGITIGLFIANPSLIYYENQIFYHHPVIFIFSLATFSFIRFIRTDNSKYLFVFYFSLSILFYIRTSFTLLWFFLILIGMILITGKILIHLKSSFLPFVLIFCLCFKNYVLFNHFSNSTLRGVSLWLTTTYISSFDKQDALKKNLISEKYFLGPWQSTIGEFKKYYGDSIRKKYKSISVLNNEASNRGINFHHYTYLQVMDTLKFNSKILLLKYPECLLKQFIWGVYFYFRPSSDNGYENIHLIYLLISKWYHPITSGQIITFNDGEPKVPNVAISKNGDYSYEEIFKSMELYTFSFFTFFIYLFFFFFFKNKILYGSNFEKTIAFFVGYNIIYLSSIYIMFGLYENNRLRHELIFFEFLITSWLFNIIFTCFFRRLNTYL